MSRIALTSDLTINLPRPGDTGDGTPGNPYDSIQRAIDDLFANYDMAGFNVTLQLASGAVGSYIFYKGFVLSGRVVGQSGLGIPLLNMPGAPPFFIGRQGRLTLRGNPAYPLGAFIFPFSGACISMSEGAAISVEGVAMDSSRTQQDCIDVFHGAFLNIQDIRFGNAGPANNLFCNHISIGMSATVYISGKVTVSGSAGCFALAGAGSCLYWNNNGDPEYTLPFEHLNGPGYRDAFVMADHGVVYAHAVAFTGAVSGLRWRAMRNGVISTNSADPNYLPGSAPGYAISGGQYT